MTFDFKALYADLAMQAVKEKRSWREMAKELGISRATLQRLGDGEGIGVVHVATILARIPKARFEHYLVRGEKG